MLKKRLFAVATLLLLAPWALAAKAKPEAAPWTAPALPDGKLVATETSPDFLKAPGTMRPGTEVAKAVPTVDFLFFPGQDYKGNPWSVWGDSVVGPDGKYYASIGDHGSVDSKTLKGNAFVFQYDPQTKTLRTVVDVRKTLNMPETDYSPGKVHSRLDFGDDGCLYFATHRGSGGATTDKFNYKGDWIMRYDPKADKAEPVVQGPVPKHCIPASILDPKRLIFYGGTAPGGDAVDKRTFFFAYDVKNKKLLYSGPNGCYRYFILAASTGKVYYERTDDKGAPDGELMRYDPASGQPPQPIGKCPGLRSATMETPQGLVYAVSSGQRGEAILWSFDVKTEKVEDLGQAAALSQTYIASIDADPTGRYLYFVLGAHGGAEKDNSAVIQYDLKTKKKKVIAFLNPFCQEKYGFTPIGTFSSAVSPQGDVLYVSWHGGRTSRWDTCALTVVHIPESERQP